MGLSNWYTGDANFDRVQALQLALVFFTLCGVGGKAPYGKHSNKSMSKLYLDPKFGWWLMELPATLSFLLTYLRSKSPQTKEKNQEAGPSPRASKFLALVFLLHYAYRGWYFPLNIRVAKGAKSSFDIAISFIGAFFVALHGYLHARMFKSLGAHLTDGWLASPRFLIGFAVYELGFWTMVHSDYTLRNLRPLDGSGPRYKIPIGGAFKFVTSPHYLGEITAFGGLTMMTRSLPSLSVFLMTCFNLVPRAFHNQSWYLQKFGAEYASLGRKRLIPFVL